MISLKRIYGLIFGIVNLIYIYIICIKYSQVVWRKID